METIFIIVVVLAVLAGILWWSSRYPEPDLTDETIRSEINVRRRQ